MFPARTLPVGLSIPIIPGRAFRGFGVPRPALRVKQTWTFCRKVGILPWEIRYRNALEPGIAMATGQIAGEDTAFKENVAGVERDLPDKQFLGHRFFDKKYRSWRGVRIRAGLRLCAKREGPGSNECRLRRPGFGHDPDPGSKRGDEPPVEKIEVGGPDTSLTPDAGTTTASRQTFLPERLPGGGVASSGGYEARSSGTA